jgi:Zn-dependent protease with chaperone function
MEVVGRYHDGVVSDVRDVICRLEAFGVAASLVIADLATREEIDRWRAADLFPLHHRKHELRVGVMGKPSGARLAFAGFEQSRAAQTLLKDALAHRHRQERGKQYRAMGLATAALVSVIVAYIYGVPLLAGSIVEAVPPAWEEQLGETVVAQIREALEPEAGWAVCDSDPFSVANLAIARFVARAMEGTGTPFTPDIQVIKTSIPNAFALPGGHSFYFSALLDQTESPDEFAGVMAHELGHVVHRHGMEQLISTSATGLLVGFVLGDMTGISVAGAIGAALIDSRFSREAEREADRFAADVAQRLSFQPAALANLLERVAGDDAMSAALALLSTHPLTSERRAYLESLAIDEAGLHPAFTDEEWTAIKTMCGGAPPAITSPAGEQRPDKSGGKGG